MKQKQLPLTLINKNENKKYFSLIFLFLFLNIAVSVNAANVTVSTAQTFGALDGSGLDDDGMANGIFTVNGDLTISPTGTISCNDPLAPPNNSACPIKIYVTGNMVIQAGGSVYSENSISGGSGGSIEITVDGNLTVFEGGITSSSRITTGGSGNGGPITIVVGGNIDFMPGSIIASSDEGGGHAGDIRITAEGTINMDGLVSAGSTYDLLPLPGRLTDFVVDRGNTTQKGAKIFVISHAVCQGAGVNIGSTGVLVSQGEDPASDSISVEACGIHVYGMIASVSKKGNGSTTNRSVVILRSGGDILINGADLGQQGTNQGRVRADYIIGEAPEAISVNLYAKDDITIIGPASGTIYSVSSNGGSATNQPGGTINATSLNAGISLTGLSLQADGGASGSAGGVINLQAKNTIDASSSTMVARGSTANSTGSDGGDVFIRSFSGNISGNASSIIDVTGGNPSPEGSVSLTACGSIGFPPGSIIPASITPALNSNCSPAAPTLPALVTALPNCGSNAAITIAPTGTTTVCAGNCVTLTATGGVSYLWSPNGETTPSISVCATGDYSVVGTNAGGCTGTSNTIHITINPNPEPSISGTLSFCSGSSTQICATTGFASYNWSTGATTQCISVSTANTFTVTVTDANGCSGSSSATTIVNSLPSSTITGSGSVCSGSSTQWCAPSGLAGYLWSTGATTQCITVASAGTFTVTVTDQNGCSSSSSKSLTVNSLPSSTITGSGSVCSGSSTQWCVPSGLADYLWSTGATTQCITVASAGTFAVTVTDQNGCSSSSSKSLIVNSLPSSTITGSGSVCSGSSTQWCAPSGLADYLWSTGATTQCVTVASAGDYTVTVLDQNGCSNSSSKSLIVNPLPSSTITGSGSVCSGSSTQWCAPSGLADYLWSTGATTQCITVASAGTFTVTVSDQNGCSSSSSKSLNVNSLPSSTITGSGSVCSGSSTQWCAPSGLSGYLWSTGATTQCITVSTASTFTVTVTNANGCSASSSRTLTVNTIPSCTITGSSICSPGSTVQICAPSGTGYTYLWNNGATTQCRTVSAGTYTVTVTNSSGCSSSCSKTVTSCTPPSCTITTGCGSNNICHGQSTTLCAPTGSGNTYLWSTGATSSCITVNSSGTYYVTVTKNGCSATCSKTITVNPVPSCTITGNSSICQGGSTSLCAPTGSGNTYLWSTGATSSCITVTCAGTYTVTVSKNGCSATCSKTVSVTTVPSCAITGSSSCGSGTVQICASSGTGYTYLWNNGATTQCRNVSPGTYTVTVTNSSGCSSSCSKTVISACSGFRTQTLGGWGAPPNGNNSAQYMYTNFASVFISPNYLTIGCTNKFKFTTPQALTTFLPSGSTPSGLPSGTLTNPNSSQGSVFASQLIAATINVKFDLAFTNFSSNSIHLQDLVIASGTFAGWTVSQVLTEANKKIGGCSSSYTYSQLNDVLNSINNNYDNGTSNNGFLLCPGTLREANEDLTEMNTPNIQTSVYPNPFNSSSTIEFSRLDEAGHMSIELFTLAGSKIVTLFDKDVEAGVKYKAIIYAEHLESGIYVYRIISGDNVINGKLILMK